MIDEKKLIEDILQHENVLASANHVYKSGYRDRQYEIIDTIKRQPKVGEWIPVSERLPETEDKVMCCTETKKGNKNIVIGYYMDGAWRCGMNSNAIAWMPLPEPYKGESE